MNSTPPNKRLEWVFLGVSTCVTGTLMALAAVYSKSLLASSATFQADLQTAVPGSLMRTVNNLFSLILTPELVIGVLIVLFVLVGKAHKVAILNFLVFFSSGVFVVSVLKSLTAEPRPYMLAGGVQRWDWVCYMEFGMPSGHCFLGVVLFEFVTRQFVLRSQERISINFPKRGRLVYRRWQIILAAVLVVVVLCICFSRIYLGMHTYAQVLLGLVCGIYSSIVYRFALVRVIQRALTRLTRLNESVQSQRQSSPKTGLYTLEAMEQDQSARENAPTRTKYVCALCATALVALAAPITIQVLQTNESRNAHLTAQYGPAIREKCGIDDISVVKSFYNKCFIDTAIVSGAFFILLGVLLAPHAAYFQGLQTPVKGRKAQAHIVAILCTLLPLAANLPHTEYVWLKFSLLFASIGLAATILLVFVPVLLIKLKWLGDPVQRSAAASDDDYDDERSLYAPLAHDGTKHLQYEPKRTGSTNSVESDAN